VLHDDHALDSVHLQAAGVPDADVRPGHHAQGARRRAEALRLLTKIAEEDPTFKWHTDRQTHEVVINGIGELHLRLVLEKLSNRGLHVDTKPPKIAYRETIQLKADGHHRHKKQTGGAGQFGEVFLARRAARKNRPTARTTAAAASRSSTKSSAAPSRASSSRRSRKASTTCSTRASIAGYPLQDVRVAITDGKHHPVDSKEVAFRTAGKLAFRTPS
jgi:elongation factor G